MAGFGEEIRFIVTRRSVGAWWAPKCLRARLRPRSLLCELCFIPLSRLLGGFEGRVALPSLGHVRFCKITISFLVRPLGAVWL